MNAHTHTKSVPPKAPDDDQQFTISRKGNGYINTRDVVKYVFVFVFVNTQKLVFVFVSVNFKSCIFVFVFVFEPCICIKYSQIQYNDLMRIADFNSHTQNSSYTVK